VTPRTTIPLILALCCAAAAEDRVVPPPPPTADPTTPLPPVVPTADATAPAPVAPTPAGDAPPRPLRGVGDRAAAAAGRAAAQERAKSLSLRVELDAGYDSNVLREDTSTPTSTDTEGLAIGGELHGTWRAIREQRGQLNLIGDLRYSNYPDESSADLARASVAAFGLLRFGFIDPGVVIGVNRQWIDEEGAAIILRGTLTATRLSPARSHFVALSFDAYRVDYDDNDDASGVLTDLLLRHWWMPEAGNARRRIEATVMAGIYSAEADVESYATIKPGLAVLYRVGESGAAIGVWDLHAQTTLEFRSYDEGSVGEAAERQTIWDVGVAAERWFGTWLSAGPFISYSIRESNRDDRDYDRVQVGARLIASW